MIQRFETKLVASICVNDRLLFRVGRNKFIVSSRGCGNGGKTRFVFHGHGIYPVEVNLTPFSSAWKPHTKPVRPPSTTLAINCLITLQVGQSSARAGPVRSGIRPSLHFD